MNEKEAEVEGWGVGRMQARGKNVSPSSFLKK